jgi:hypothetical protein
VCAAVVRMQGHDNTATADIVTYMKAADEIIVYCNTLRNNSANYSLRFMRPEEAHWEVSYQQKKMFFPIKFAI